MTRATSRATAATLQPACRGISLRTLRDLSRAAWPDASELRIGLGCMRLSTDEARDEDRALETITAAVQAGITVFDTAHAYGHGPDELGHNERLLARALRGAGAAERARIVTKGGMTRAGGGWIADGRAKAIRADCEASLEALDGIPIDLYLIHAPDPRTPWSTSVRALGATRRRRRRETRRRRERQPPPAGRGPRPRADRGSAGRAQPVRRQRAPRRRARALRRARDRACRPLPARRPTACGQRRPAAGVGGRGGVARRDAGRGRACMAARALAGRRPDPGRPSPGDGTLRRTGRRRSSSTTPIARPSPPPSAALALLPRAPDPQRARARWSS